MGILKFCQKHFIDLKTDSTDDVSVGKMEDFEAVTVGKMEDFEALTLLILLNSSPMCTYFCKDFVAGYCLYVW